MDETRHIYKQITVTSSSDNRQHERGNSTIADTSFYTKTHAEKADLLSQLYSPSGEKENATTDVGYITQSAVEYVPTRNGVHTNSATISYPADRQNTSSEAYIKIMRAHYTQEILQALQKVQVHAGMPSASATPACAANIQNPTWLIWRATAGKSPSASLRVMTGPSTGSKLVFSFCGSDAICCATQ